MSELVHELLNMDNIGLARNFRVNPSSCGNSSYYHEYLAFSAMGELTTGRGMTHLLIDSLNHRIAGYVTLRTASLVSADAKGLNRNGKPVIEISELAVDRDYERHGVGTELLNLTIMIADDLRRNQIGFCGIVVCADPSAVSFYKDHYGFVALSSVYEMLHDGWNDRCIPLYLQLPEIHMSSDAQ